MSATDKYRETDYYIVRSLFNGGHIDVNYLSDVHAKVLIIKTSLFLLILSSLFRNVTAIFFIFRTIDKPDLLDNFHMVKALSLIFTGYTSINFLSEWFDTLLPPL